MPDPTSRLEGLRSLSPSSPTPILKLTSSRRHTSEAPAASNLKPPSKRRRLLASTTTDEVGNTRSSLSASRLPPISSADYSQEEDELSFALESAGPPSATERPSSQPRPPASIRQRNQRNTPSLPSALPPFLSALPSLPPAPSSPPPAPAPGLDSASSPETDEAASMGQGAEIEPEAGTDGSTVAIRPNILRQKVTSFGDFLLGNPPRPLSPGSDTAQAAAQVSSLQEEYKAVQRKLAVAKARLSEQLTTDAPTPSTTPASLRAGSRSTNGVSRDVEMDEDEAVASQISHINSLERHQSSLLEGLYAARVAEIGAKERRDLRQLTKMHENKKLYRRLMDLGPTGTASLLRVLLKASGVVPEGSARTGEAARPGPEITTPSQQRTARIRQQLEEDIAREELLAAPEAPSSQIAASGRFGQSGQEAG